MDCGVIPGSVAITPPPLIEGGDKKFMGISPTILQMCPGRLVNCGFELGWIGFRLDFWGERVLPTALVYPNFCRPFRNAGAGNEAGCSFVT